MFGLFAANGLAMAIYAIISMVRMVLIFTSENAQGARMAGWGSNCPETSSLVTATISIYRALSPDGFASSAFRSSSSRAIWAA
jgi:uncharacterized sodium:solute symporter family permease YidK